MATNKLRPDWGRLTGSHPVLDAVPARLRASACVQAFAQGAIVHRVGDRVRNVYAVLTGELRLLRTSHEGREIILQRARTGFVAEASVQHRTYHCDIAAAVDSEVLAFPAKEFCDALDRDRSFRTAWIEHLSRELRLQRTRSERLGLRGAAEHICHCIETEGVNGALTLTQSRRAWGLELGLTHEALYRTLARLQASGRLVISGSTLVLARAPLAVSKQGAGGPT